MTTGSMYSIENDIKHAQYPLIGIDEVGRGCFAGPLVVGAVLLDSPLEGLQDSKDVKSVSRREELAETIKQSAVSWSIGEVSAEIIDEIGLTNATEKAIELALDGLNGNAVDIVMDGRQQFLPERNVRSVINADSFISGVMAAGIIAKVYRDQLMQKEAELHPEYGFDKNVGYGTLKHIQALELYGPVDGLHRQKNVRRVREIVEHRNNQVVQLDPSKRATIDDIELVAA